MMLIASYSLRDNKAAAFREWVLKNSEAGQKHAPPGWKYLGVYFYVLGFSGAGRYDAETWWEGSSELGGV